MVHWKYKYTGMYDCNLINFDVFITNHLPSKYAVKTNINFIYLIKKLVPKSITEPFFFF